jgi:hypothetical protein
MKLFYKYFKWVEIDGKWEMGEEDTTIVTEVIRRPDGRGETQQKTPKVEAQALVDRGEAIIYETLDALYDDIQYKMDRAKKYPAIEDQLDQIYHEGFDAWKETITSVKDAHPKPE